MRNSTSRPYSPALQDPLEGTATRHPWRRRLGHEGRDDDQLRTPAEQADAFWQRVKTPRSACLEMSGWKSLDFQLDLDPHSYQ